MSRLFTELTKEAEKQQKSFQKPKVIEPQPHNPTPSTDVTTPVTDAAMPDTDAADRHRIQTLDRNKLKTIISELSTIKVSDNSTSVRISETEKQDIEDFIYMTLRKNGLSGKGVSSAKLMRYALRYLMKVHEEEFISALSEALKKDGKLSI